MKNAHLVDTLGNAVQKYFEDILKFRIRVWMF